MDWGSGAFILSTIIVAGGIVGIVGIIVVFMSTAEEPDNQLERLRQEYRKLLRQYESRYDDYDCGRALAEHICVDLSEWGRRIREIEVEIEAIKEEVERDTDPGGDRPEVV